MGSRPRPQDRVRTGAEAVRTRGKRSLPCVYPMVSSMHLSPWAAGVVDAVLVMEPEIRSIAVNRS